MVSLTAVNSICAQQTSTDSSKFANRQKLTGQYDAKNKTYFGQFVYEWNVHLLHRYESKNMETGVGILEYQITHSKSGKMGEKRYGLVDTSGTVLALCIYLKLEQTRKPGIYKFTSDKFIGLYEINHGEILVIPRRIGNFNSYVNTSDTNLDYCVVTANNNYGLFSISQKKLSIPIKYKTLKIFGNNSVCGSTDTFLVYNCISGDKSVPFKEVIPLNNGRNYFVRLFNNKAFLSSNPIEVDATNRFNRTPVEVLEFHKGRIIAKTANNKFGLIDEKDNLLVPYIYEDIYFLDADLLLVKKDNLWAISNTQNSILSPFVFQDVDKQNRINFENTLQFTGIDSLKLNTVKFNKPFEATLLTSESLGKAIQAELVKMKKILDSRIVLKFDKNIKPRYAFKSEKGYQFVTIYPKGEVVIDTMVWDNIFMIPYIYNCPFEIGIEKNKKFGYLQPHSAKNIAPKYDGIYFQHSLFFHSNLMHTGTHNEQSPFVVCKNETIYALSSFSKKDWSKILFTNLSYTKRYQEKPKYRKVMKLDAFLVLRSKN